MNAPLTNLYRKAEDYFFRGIASKCLDLDDGAHAYMTGGAELNFFTGTVTFFLYFQK